MKTVALLLLGALLAATLIYAFREPSRPESSEVADQPAAAGKTEAASATLPPANATVPKETLSEGTAVVPTTTPATRRERERLAVAPEVFDQVLKGSSETEGMPKPPAEIMHERFSREVTDPNWSPNVEPQVKGHMQTEAAMKLIDFVSLECREATCEIWAASPSVELNSQSIEEFQARFFAMANQAWWTGYGFKYPSVSLSFAPDGRAIMIAHISTLNSR